MSLLNFSWVTKGRLAGHQAPWSIDDLAWLKKQGIKALVRMAEKNKAMVSAMQVEGLGLRDCYEPVGDFTAPTHAQINRMVSFISKSLSEGGPVGVSCGAGLGRTGAILACYLVNQGLSAEAAMTEVRNKRPGSLETREQEEAVRAYAHQTRNHR